MTQAAVAASFPVRRPEFDFTTVPRLFFDDNAFGSAFWIVLQALFPDGERFFIKAVRDVRDRIDDPQLQRDVDAFIRQEANHGRAHRAVNDMAQEVHRVDVKTIERRTRKIFAFFDRTHTPMQRLAMTAAAEHFTATVARFLLRHPEYLARFRDPETRRLVMWHALEEREHRAVAFDVYQRAGGGYWLRAAMMPWMFGLLGPWLAYEVVRMAATLGGFSDRAELRRGLDTLVSRKGIMMKIGPGLRDYFRRDFHPNDDDQSALEAQWRAELGFVS